MKGILYMSMKKTFMFGVVAAGLVTLSATACVPASPKSSEAEIEPRITLTFPKDQKGPEWEEKEREYNLEHSNGYTPVGTPTPESPSVSSDTANDIEEIKGTGDDTDITQKIIYDITYTVTEIPLSDLDQYKVKRVVDGDTFVISLNGSDTKVRLIGVDTPESVASDEYLEKTGKENSEAGKTASDYTKSLIDGKTVYLEYDASTEDKYGRLLAYCYLSDGRMLQEILLSEGYANLMTVQPNVKYVERLTAAAALSHEE